MIYISGMFPEEGLIFIQVGPLKDTTQQKTRCPVEQFWLS